MNILNSYVVLRLYTN